MKATLYTTSAFGLVKTEVNTISVAEKPYAQYTAALEHRYVPKGKRKPCGFVKGYKPYTVVVLGHGHPNPADPFTPVKNEGGIKVSKSRASSFDESWEVEADEFIAAHFTAEQMVVDYRHTLGTKKIAL